MPSHSAHYRQVILDRDHARPRNQPAPTADALEARLTELVGPAAMAVGDATRALGLRNRVLTLPVMVSAVLTLIWRQVPSVSELVRVLDELLPTLRARAAARSRPVPAVITAAQQHYAYVWAVDGTTLERVFHKVGLLRPDKTTQAGGKAMAVLDVATRLPVALWLDADAHANDLRFVDQIQDLLTEPTLLLADAQFTSFPFWDALTDAKHALICRAKTNLAIGAVERVIAHTPRVRDRVIRAGSQGRPCEHPVRLIEVSADGRKWHRLICTELDPTKLRTTDIVDLYAQRWRIEDAFLVTKRLLGLSYLWSGAFNAIAMQFWATWLFYAVLVDLTDAVADSLNKPLGDLSVERVYRGLYHYTVAAARGDATDPVAYLAAQTDLGIVKRTRKYRLRQWATRDAWRQELNL